MCKLNEINDYCILNLIKNNYCKVNEVNNYFKKKLNEISGYSVLCLHPV